MFQLTFQSQRPSAASEWARTTPPGIRRDDSQAWRVHSCQLWVLSALGGVLPIWQLGRQRPQAEGLNQHLSPRGQPLPLVRCEVPGQPRVGGRPCAEAPDPDRHFSGAIPILTRLRLPGGIPSSVAILQSRRGGWTPPALPPGLTPRPGRGPCPAPDLDA